MGMKSAGNEGVHNAVATGPLYQPMYSIDEYNRTVSSVSSGDAPRGFTNHTSTHYRLYCTP